jgi:hypothetical protein
MKTKSHIHQFGIGEEFDVCNCGQTRPGTGVLAKPHHTPTPWESVNYNGKWLIDSVDKVGSIAVINGGKDKLATANAEYIVRAVNAHEDLLMLLYRIRAMNNQTPLLGTDFVEDINQAIAKAEGR